MSHLPASLSTNPPTHPFFYTARRPTTDSTPNSSPHLLSRGVRGAMPPAGGWTAPSVLPDEEDDEAEKSSHFAKLLDTDALLDEPKLRLEASSGVPPPFRAQVWLLLLHAHRSAPVASHARFAPLVAAFDRDGAVGAVVRAELRAATHSPRFPVARSPQNVARFLSVVGAHLASKQGIGAEDSAPSEDVRDMVRIATPLLAVFSNDEDAYAAFSSIMFRMRSLFRRDGLNGAVRDFLMLFKRIVPDLHELFVDTDFDVSVWAPSALRSVLCRQLPAATAYRLLDSYIARGEANWVPFHLHLCVALLAVMYEHDVFNDLEGESFLPRLQDLPPNLPIELIINRAVTYQQDSDADGFIPAGSTLSKVF